VKDDQTKFFNFIIHVKEH